MVQYHRRDAGIPVKACFFAVEGLFLLVTIASLIDLALGLDLGLSLLTFFCGFIASAWGAIFYPICKSSLDWTRDHR